MIESKVERYSVNVLKKKLLVLMDWAPPEDWVFKKQLEHYFDTDIFFDNTKKGYNSTLEKIVALWRSYVLTGYSAFLKIRNYDLVYAWHAVMGLVVAFLCRFFHAKRPKIVIAQLIIPKRPASLNQYLREAFIRYALKRVDTVIVYSTIEAEQFEKRYGNGSTLFTFLPLGIELSNHRPASDEHYIFSGGRSNRDYATLVKAVTGLNFKVKIAAQRFNVSELALPENVETYFDVYGESFSRLLAGATIVVIPLERADESSGQLVLLNAMAFGKPIIITRSRGVEDYIRDGENVITVPRQNMFALRTELDNLLNSPEERRRLGVYAKESVKSFSIAKQAERVARLLDRSIEENYDLPRMTLHEP
ncbi:glycosyltransferase [candidate division KSB1 bacterium]|nr:glycosyltransferase family 4 protein [candidate division KSB1 bacterium]RQW06289.1 MAG: glycosyltransferase [candidate division KSB1 bacterium]